MSVPAPKLSELVARSEAHMAAFVASMGGKAPECHCTERGGVGAWFGPSRVVALPDGRFLLDSGTCGTIQDMDTTRAMVRAIQQSETAMMARLVLKHGATQPDWEHGV